MFLGHIERLLFFMAISLVIVFSFGVDCFAASDLKKNSNFVTGNYFCHVGDLLFQSLPCGKFCNAIDQVTYGVGHTRIDHVAIVVSCGAKPYVAEAVDVGVRKLPLRDFLAHSHDKFNNPRVWVGRVVSKYRKFIPAAVSFVQHQYGKPYNNSFINSSNSFYCSQLIVSAFSAALGKAEVFSNKPMNFKNLRDRRMVPQWVSYYKKMHMKVPQGMPGSNPGQLSRSDNITIVAKLGRLPLDYQIGLRN